MKHSRLSATDTAFLAFEEPDRPMWIGALALFDRNGSEATAPRIHAAVAQLLGAIPRFGERLAADGRDRWVRDPDFDPAHHVQGLHTPLASDGAGLRSQIGRLLAAPAAADRPLWQAFVLTGLDGGTRFALFLKIHHALLDGAAGVGLLMDRLGTGGAPSRPERAAQRRARARSGPRGILSLLRRLRPTSATTLNGDVGAGREVAWLSLDESLLRSAARDADASLNDALLALVSGGLRRWLESNGETPERVRLRAMCPVDAGRGARDDALGNRLGAWLVDLPVRHADPAARLRAVAASTRSARDGGQARGVEWLGTLSGWIGSWLPRLAMRLAGRLRIASLVVTQPPKLPGRLALLDCPMLSITPFAPLFHGQRCAIAALRQDGRVQLGITGGWRSPEPTRRLAEALQREIDALAWSSATACREDARRDPRAA